jgi:hypothetical protein
MNSSFEIFTQKKDISEVGANDDANAAKGEHHGEVG